MKIKVEVLDETVEIHDLENLIKVLKNGNLPIIELKIFGKIKLWSVIAELIQRVSMYGTIGENLSFMLNVQDVGVFWKLSKKKSSEIKKLVKLSNRDIDIRIKYHLQMIECYHFIKLFKRAKKWYLNVKTVNQHIIKNLRS